MKQENINILQENLDTLIKKHSELINKNDFGGALNVMKNIDCLNSQLKRMDYVQMASAYTLIEENGDHIPVVSMWEQNSFGDIKNSKTYKTCGMYKTDMGMVIDSLSKNWDNLSQDIKDNFIKLFQK